MTSYFKFDVKG